MSDCIFCNIIEKKLPSKAVYEDENFYAFHDIHPQAPVHIVVVPKKHLTSCMDLKEGDVEMAGRLLLTINRIAEEIGLKNGYRTVINTGPDGGQTVSHLHCHLLGKRRLQWPPG